MKRSALALTTAAAVVALAGAAVGGYALTTGPEPTDTPAAVSTETPAPGDSSTPEATPSASAAAPVEVEAPSSEPVAGTPEDEFLYYAGQAVRGYGYEITDEQLLEAGQYTCDQLAAGVSPFDIAPIEGAGEGTNGGFISAAQKYLC